MIKSVTVRNFKCLKDVTQDFAALTVLSGLNGSGKSSMVQALMCIRAALRHGNGDHCELRLSDETLNLGTVRDMYYQFNPSVDNVVSLMARGSGGAADVTLEFAYESKLSKRDAVDMLRRDRGAVEDVAMLLYDFSGVRRLQATRLSPRYEHAYSETRVEARDFGPDGKYAVAYLMSHGKDAVLPDLRRADPAAAERTVSGLLDQVGLWMKLISPDVTVRQPRELSANSVALMYGYGEQEFKPENVGVGLSIVLPILVMVLSAKKGDCLIIENPESDLHPKGQSELALLFAKAAHAGIQIILETHSDHMINGVRVAVKQGVVTKDEVLFSFYRRHDVPTGDGLGREQYATVRTVPIDQYGTLLEDVPDFLDEWGKQIDKLIGLEDVSSIGGEGDMGG